MQYSPFNAIPYLARVDAGTIDLIRSFGIEVVTSADLVQRFEAVWTDRQLESHRYATEALRRIVDESFAHVGASITKGRPLTEYGLQQFILARIRDAGMTASSAPIVAVDAHSADPHYGPVESHSSLITCDNLLLIDLWAKRTEPGSVYGDITWTGYTGEQVPAKQRLIFDHVRRGRDAALSFVRERVASGRLPFGWEVDDVCRNVIREAGYGDFFVHRTGHSIGEEVHGNGANIDNLETQDGRRLMSRTCFSIEPGIYLPGEFGIRSELDVYVSDGEAVVYGEPLQSDIVPIL
jgi:Xaa-Pro aminopeptidase